LASVEFLDAFHALRKFEVSYAKKLTNLDGLSYVASTLEELELGHLPKISRYEHILAGMKLLKKLRLSKCPPLADLKFVQALPKLEFFSFVDTNVLSGDITPCMGLKYVGFLDKKNFNCTWNRSENRLVLKSANKAKSKGT
jgi:hypothetical protein